MILITTNIIGKKYLKFYEKNKLENIFFINKIK